MSYNSSRCVIVSTVLYFTLGKFINLNPLRNPLPPTPFPRLALGPNIMAIEQAQDATATFKRPQGVVKDDGVQFDQAESVGTGSGAEDQPFAHFDEKRKKAILRKVTPYLETPETRRSTCFQMLTCNRWTST
jgi:hypothetical protein